MKINIFLLFIACFLITQKSKAQTNRIPKLLDQQVRILTKKNQKIIGKVLNEDSIKLSILATPTLQVDVEISEIKKIDRMKLEERNVYRFTTVYSSYKPQKKIAPKEVVEIFDLRTLLNKKVQIETTKQQKITGEVIEADTARIAIKVNPTLIVEIDKKSMKNLYKMKPYKDGTYHYQKVDLDTKVYQFGNNLFGNNYFLIPSAYNLPKGQVQYRNTEFAFHKIDYGINDRISIGFGMDLLNLLTVFKSPNYLQFNLKANTPVKNLPLHIASNSNVFKILRTESLIFCQDIIITTGNSFNNFSVGTRYAKVLGKNEEKHFSPIFAGQVRLNDFVSIVGEYGSLVFTNTYISAGLKIHFPKSMLSIGLAGFSTESQQEIGAAPYFGFMASF